MTNLLVILGIAGVSLIGVQFGYMLGCAAERKRNTIRTRYAPMQVRRKESPFEQFTLPAGRVSGIQYGPELPDLPKWKRGGRR
jgi:hypothetical protein